MPSRPVPRAAARKKPSRAVVVGSSSVVALVAGLLAWSSFERDRPARLLEVAETATRARDRPAALVAWQALNQTRAATSKTLLAEARAALALDRAVEARTALERASIFEASDAEVWRARLDLLRVLDRPFEALQFGPVWRSVDPVGRRGVLTAITLAVLAEIPDDEARKILGRWIAADPNDLDARISLLTRIAANPHPGDPDRASRITDLSALLSQNPGQVAAREALLIALADAGEPDRGREVLEGWPESARDARYHRLRGRWDLDYDHRPDRAAESYRLALIDLPQDWKIHYGLARALRSLGQDDAARSEAQTVARLRERLDPSSLGPRLTADLTRPDDPRSLRDLAELSESVGLTRLAEAWRLEADARPVP